MSWRIRPRSLGLYPLALAQSRTLRVSSLPSGATVSALAFTAPLALGGKHPWCPRWREISAARQRPQAPSVAARVISDPVTVGKDPLEGEALPCSSSR